MARKKDPPESVAFDPSRLVTLKAVANAIHNFGEVDGASLTGRQQLVLIAVAEGTNEVRTLARTLSLSKPAITRALDALEEREFVERVANEVDRRCPVIVLTQVGADFLASVTDEIAKTSASPAASARKKAA